MAEKLYKHPRIAKEESTYHMISAFLDEPVSELVESRYFIKYQSEKKGAAGKKHLEQRKERAYHKAISSPSLHIHLDHILSQNYSFSEPAKKLMGFLVDEDIGDATGNDEPFSEFINEACKWRAAHGFVAVLVDGPQNDPELSEAQRQALDLHPYFVVYDGQEVINFQCFESGIHKGKFELFIVKAPSARDEKGKQKERRYRFIADGVSGYVKETLQESGDGWEVVGTPEESNTFPYIPVRIWGRGLVDSWLMRAVELEKASFNLGSASSNTIYQQCFKINVAVGISSDEMKNVGESQFHRVKNPDAKILSIDEGNPIAAIEEQDRVSRAAASIAMMKHNRVVESKQVESAESKQHDANGRIRAYNRFCNQLTRFINGLLYYAAIFEGIDEATAQEMTFSIPRDFGLGSFEEEHIKSTTLLGVARETKNKVLYDQTTKTLISNAQFVNMDDMNDVETKRELFKSVDESELVQSSFMPSQFEDAVEDDE